MRFSSHGLPNSRDPIMRGIIAGNQQFPAVHNYNFELLLTPRLSGKPAKTDAGYRLSPLAAGIIIAILVQIAVLPVTSHLPVRSAPPAAADIQGRLKLPHPLLLGICFFTFGTTLVEGAVADWVADWAAVFLRDSLGAKPGIAGLGISVFSFCLASTRFLGDRLRQVTTPGLLGQALAAIGLTGIGLVWLASSIPMALAGLGVLGIGAALAFLLGVSAAANVAVLSFAALLGFLAGPLAIGFVADAYDIRVGWMVLAPVLALSLLLAPFLTVAAKRREETG